MQRTLTLSYFLLLCFSLSAQMTTEQGPRYGNEWLRPGTDYLRIEVADDGMYRVDAATLSAAGFSTDAQLQLHYLGEQIPLEVTTSGVHFYGTRTRGALDAFLFTDPVSQQLNPRYGMYTDTAAYYLSIAEAGTQVQRYTEGAKASGTTPTTTIYRTIERVFGDHQSKFFRRNAGTSIVFSHYELAEGFGSRKSGDLLSSNGTTTSTVQLDLPGAVEGTAQLRLRFGLAFGEVPSGDDHVQQIRVNNQSLGQLTSEGWGVHDLEYSFDSDDRVDIELTGSATDQDKANLAFVRVTYPAEARLVGEQLSFSLPAGDARTISFTGLPEGSRLYEPATARVYLPGPGGEFSVPAAGESRDFVLLSQYVAPASTAQMTARDILPEAGTDYLILTSRRLGGADIEALASYRASAVGGGYRVHTAYVEDVYDYFGYGLRRHPQALRNYLDAALQRSSELRYLFIIGKGREYTDLRTSEELAEAWSTFFVPSFGLPASDNLLSARPGEVTPRLATGRLSAINTEEISLYLKKLREVEAQTRQAAQTIEDIDWMKQALFLGGGQTPGEQNTIRINLGRMEEIFENSKFGGEVTSLFRTSSDPIETTRQELIFDRINNGTSIINFYGHSSSQGFDFNIDNPENYKNKDKYPLMLSLGCYSGDAFTAARSISERFIFIPDGGAITFAASKGIGYLSALGSYGRSLYHHLGNDLYGMGVGDIIQATIADYEGTGNFFIGILLEQFSLSGDPAFRLHPRPGPDLVVDPASVRFIPAVVPAQDTSFGVSLTIKNLGIKGELVPDSTLLRFRQQLPSGEVRELGSYRVAVPPYAEEVKLRLPAVGFAAVGQNRILVSVDPTELIAELPAPGAETNNDLAVGGEAGVPLTVIANTARVAFPPPYAVVGPGVNLVAGSSNPLAPERRYRMQIAEEIDFSDPLVDEEIVAPGGIIRYQPALAFSDSTTYYWRISPDSSRTEDAGFIWSQSNFTYLEDQAPEEVDFALQHPGQLADGTTDDLNISATEPDWKFGRNTTDIQIFNAVYEGRNLPRLVWNGTRFNSPFPWHVRAGIQVMVVDSINNSEWFRSPGDGSFNTVARKGTPWSFDTRTEPGREGLMDFIENGIPDGSYVFVYSAQRGNDIEYHNEGWEQDSIRLGKSIYSVLEDQGAEQVRLLEQLGSVPYTFAYLKGVGKLGEAVATSQEATTEILFPIYENRESGTYTSKPVGPSLEWEAMRLTFRDGPIGSADSCHFYLYGETATGNRTLLQEAPLDIRSQLTFDFDLSDYDASQYPYLVTQLGLFDGLARSVVSVDELYIDYRRPGDVAVSPAVAYSVPDSLSQGQTARLEIGYENIARTDMDSMLAELTVIDVNNNITTLRQRQGPLAAGATDRVTFDLPTESENDQLRLQLVLNPDDDQPEDIRFNNTLGTDLGVTTDLIAPDLKVYYDGRRIRDGELVSGKPEILIQLRDESDVRRLDDSSAYFIQLKSPDGSEETIRMSDRRVDFVPAAGGGENRAEVYFRPELLQDGEYTLTVQASDRSNNKSGRLAYSQSFEVINQQLISNVLTYPNPFTTQTRFVYTLTGSIAPEVFRIQIMTVSGRVVRDIDLLAHENVSVGTHQTDFAWDGTDEYGDLLANGVYLYRVITSDGDRQELESYDTGTDQFFKNGLGKVVILR